MKIKRHYDDVYKDWRLSVLKRDGFKCQMPGCSYSNRRYLQVHHISKWSSSSSLRFEISNGITLCYSCHKSISGKEHHYESLFTDIIRGKNGKRK